ALGFRVSDVCLPVDGAVMVAVLARALTGVCLAEWHDGRPVPDVHPQIMRVAAWQAARYGMSAELIDPLAARPRPAGDLAESLLAFTRPALEETGDWDEVGARVEVALERGTGAACEPRACSG